jgi:hypothetical protein
MAKEEKKTISANEPKKFNLRLTGDDVKLNIDPNLIPTLTPIDKIKEFMVGDSDPYYKIQAIDYPVKANGYTYTEQFFKSFIDKLNYRYIPGSRNGHSTRWGERPATDLFLIGGRVDSVGNGSGTVYLKNYIPKSGESGDNSFFIKENKANAIDYSLVAYTRDESMPIPDGGNEWHVIESLFGERNDAVEYGKGSMKQKTNSFNEDESNKKNNRGNTMEKNELLDGIKALKENALVSLPEIAKHIGLDALIVTDEHKNALSLVNELKQLCGNVSPLDFVKSIIEEKKANATKIRESEMMALVGPQTYSDSGKKNELREFADVFFAGKEINDQAKADFKANSITQKLAGERADWSSPQNLVGQIGQGEKKNIGGISKI